ncbi:Small-conductance mechanosensitive channel [Methanocella conradii HZ254]|uniref:Small-conductance mechanosensitive channel n=1 Tax=Methanocella conradii (strain DSM 24694 / JCM 17849 / CGMCC 1.5162 / HZ254) TaxID=1041930 RepID=H8I902_METCZ|nr:mechanosensitive ion channel domain-containing protein [Methanocella conradii]AFD00473.1 Small-conductance mechanosensitive channel [Methanocella conradii HZ254]
MLLDIFGISVETTTLYILGIILGAFIAWYILGTVINNLFASYPEDSRESIHTIFSISIAYISITLIVFVLSMDLIVLVAMFALLLGVILYMVKDFLKDFFTRISLLSVKAFGIGDYIEVAHHKGRVLKVGNLYTMLRRDDNSVVCVPNQMVARSIVINYTRADYIKLQEAIVLKVSEADISKVYNRILEELDIFGYKRAKIMHSTTPDGVRFAVTINLEDAASISNDTSNLHKALNIVKGEFITD